MDGIEISDREYRAWYGLGQTYELLKLFQFAVHYHLKAAALRPSDARMWVAVGNCYLQVQLTHTTHPLYPPLLILILSIILT